MSTRRVITKILVGAAIAAGAGPRAGARAAAAPPPPAGPNPIGTEPSPYGTLGCNCRETAPAGSPQLSEEINRGFREGLTVSIPGLPAPDRSGPPLPR